MKADGSETVISLFVLCCLSAAIACSVAFTMSGSLAVLACAIFASVAFASGALQRFGHRRMLRAPDVRHAFGFSQEAPFWSFIIAIMLFALGAGVALTLGLRALVQPQPVTNPHWAYAALALASLVLVLALLRTLRIVDAEFGLLDVVQAQRSAKHPSAFVSILSVLAVLACVGVAAAGVFLTVEMRIGHADAAAAAVVGFVMAVTSVLLCLAVRRHLVGAAAQPVLRSSLRNLVRLETGVGKSLSTVGDVRTIELTAGRVLVAIDVKTSASTPMAETVAALDRLRQSIRDRHPEVRDVFFDLILAGGAGPLVLPTVPPTPDADEAHAVAASDHVSGMVVLDETAARPHVHTDVRKGKKKKRRH